MPDIFNGNVTTKSYGYKDRVYRNSSVGHDYMKEKNAKRQQEIATESANMIEMNNRNSEVVEARNKRVAFEKNRVKVMNQIATEGASKIFTAFMMQTFLESLYLDKEYKDSHMSEIGAIVESYIGAKGGIKYLENAEKTSFNKDLLKICKENAQDAAYRIIKEAAEEKEPTLDVKFKLKDDEKSKLNKDLSELNSDKLAELVKDKVLTVVKDEKERAEEKEKFQKDLEAGDEAAVKESFRLKVRRTSIDEETTLWEALMKSSFKEIVKESIAFHFPVVSDNRDNVGVTADEEMDYHTLVKQADAEYEFDQDNSEELHAAFSADTFNFDKAPGDPEQPGEVVASDSNEDSRHKDEGEVDMDEVMAEAMLKYTFLEMLHTAKMEKYDRKDVQKLAGKFAH